ncbi:hypothetical protein ABEW34_17035 [Paenibacillus algorifonticola]|uniref:hypothetical protein n=1 Tax=Paenibacillus algorifonticola TaxID=684063 RepID=UPI003D2B1A09
MVGFMNKCPHCGYKSSFTPEEAECDKALMLWCNHCGHFINQSFTIQTFEKWWSRYDEGEELFKPPISKQLLIKLQALENEIRADQDCFLDHVQIHLKDFTDYLYCEEETEEERISQPPKAESEK